MKFDDGGVGPCSDCGNDVNVNLKTDACKAKVLCPACQGDYLAKKKIREALKNNTATTPLGEVTILGDKKELILVDKKSFEKELKL